MHPERLTPCSSPATPQNALSGFLFSCLNLLRRQISGPRDRRRRASGFAGSESLEGRALLAFSPTNILVFATSTSTTQVANNKTAQVSLDEYAPNGTNPAAFVASLSVPTGATGLTDVPSDTSTGWLNLSGDGQYLVLAGAAEITGESIGNTTPRSVARYDIDGNFRQIARLSGAGFNSNKPATGATTVGGGANDVARYWIGSQNTNNGGTLTFNSLATNTFVGGASRISTSVPSNISIFKNVLFASVSGQGGGISALLAGASGGLPAATATVVPIIASSNVTGGFFFLDRSPTVGEARLNGLDTLYIIGGTGSQNIQKYEYNGTSWVLQGQLQYTSALYGLSGRLSTAGVSLVATTTPNTDVRNSIVFGVDSAAFGQAPSGTLTNVATAPTGKVFKGVQFAPVVADTAPPTATFSPANAAANVDINSNLVLTFNEPVTKGTGTISVLQAGTSTPISINIDSANVAISADGLTVTVDIPSPLLKQTNYSVQISAGAFRDLATNLYAGISDTTTWAFKTGGDIIPPTVVINDDDTDNLISLGDSITYTLVFSEPISTSSVLNFGNSGSAGVGFTILSGPTFTAGNTSVTLTVRPTATVNGLFQLSILGSSTISDVEGNLMSVPVNDDDIITVNVAPASIAVSPNSINENTVGKIGDLSAVDPGDTLTFAVVGVNPDFQIVQVGSSWELRVVRTGGFNYETAPPDKKYSVLVRATDTGGLSTEQNLQIQILDINEAPENISISGTSIAENKANTKIGDLSAVDPEGQSVAFTIVSVNGNTADTTTFEILQNGGVYSLFNKAAFNYEALAAVNYSFTVVVRASDASTPAVSDTKVLNISVNNVTESTAIDVQLGQYQRSFVRYLDVIFDRPDDLNSILSSPYASRFMLKRGAVDTLTKTLTDQNMTAHSITPLVTAATDSSGVTIPNTLRLDFGVQGIGGNRGATTGDGYYEMQLDPDGDGNFETNRWKFYRLLGDVAGRTVNGVSVADGKVDSLDRSAIQAAYNTRNPERDANGDGFVNSTDWTVTARSDARKLRLDLFGNLSDY
ncbi:MAG: hypothetical protein RLZZ458_2598 [Planctomycetota bacterium]